LFTVAAYRLLFGVSYSFRTYTSLLPLTFGVMLACTFDVAGSNLIGLLCAFGSALVFVSSNIFFKKIMPSNGAATAHKLDKLNLLFYSSGLAFLLMIPIWMYYDFGHLWRHWHDETLVSDPAKPTAHGVMYYFFMNGTVHWAQNIIAFAILSSTSPVTYSIASLIKRVAVICIAIVWFSQSVHPVQAVGIMLTFVGLWMYNQAKSDVERGENKARRVEAGRQLQLPTTKSELLTPNGSPRPDHVELHTYQAAPPRSHPPMRQANGMSINIPASKPPHGPRLPISPTESYPSPPPSLDSPPPSASARSNGNYVNLKNRKGTHEEGQNTTESDALDTTPKLHAQPLSQF
jgi:solute carrier family 35 protein E1